jgi:hypothetical protein
VFFKIGLKPAEPIKRKLSDIFRQTGKLSIRCLPVLPCDTRIP